MVVDHLLASVWTRTSSEQSLAEIYTTLLEEHNQVTSEMLEVRICSLLTSPKLTTVVQ
jgi:hypothetical protein